MRKPILYGIVGVLVLFVALPQVASGYLSDLAGHWSASLVSALEAKGMISGDERGRFDPDAPLTRAQMAKLFTVGLGYEADATQMQMQASQYPDVPLGHWSSGFIEMVTELGIAEGYPDGAFRPDEPVTRAQLAALVVRAAGLAERARLARVEPTSYRDDAEIPAWARGSVFVAQAEGLMMGTPEGYFLPNRPITRSQGAATVYRLMARNGSLFHLAGTLVRYDAELQTGTVRDALGQERAFTMSPDAIYLRQGVRTLPEGVRVLDQVYIVLDDSGLGMFLEARYQDLQADEAIVQDGKLLLTLSSGQQEVRDVQPGALILVNGRPSTLQAVSGAGPIYVALDETTGEVRLVDAVKASAIGTYSGLTEGGRSVRVTVDGQEVRYVLASDPIVILDYERVGLDALLLGDEVLLGLDEEGRLVYLEVVR